MISKIWKKILFVILIIACLFNIISKLVNRNSFKSELQASAQYVQNLIMQEENNKDNINEANNENLVNEINNSSTTNYTDNQSNNVNTNTVVIQLNKN